MTYHSWHVPTSGTLLLPMDVVQQFGREAEKYLASPTHGDQAELSDFMKLVQPHGGHIIDLATGAGHCAFAVAPFVDRVTLCDVTPRMLEVAMAEGERRGLTNLEVLQADCHDLPVPAASFDGAICRLAAHHFLQPWTFLAEVHRVLKPGGWFLFVDTVGIEEDVLASKALDQYETIRDPSHVCDYLASQWREWCEQTGFAVEHQSSLHHRYPLTTWLDRMSVQEPQRSECTEILRAATGALKSYLSPECDENGEWSFLLHQTVIVARRGEQ